MTNRYFGVIDNATTTIPGGLTAGATSVTVANGAVFTGAELPFEVTVADPVFDTNMEKMIVTAVAGNVLTVQRAFESSDINHGANSVISLRVTYRHVKDLIDNAVMALQMDAYVETVTNATLQVTSATAWETPAKLVKLAEVSYTYLDSISRLPAGATRLIYKGDGVTVRRTETTSFTWQNGELLNLTRAIT